MAEGSITIKVEWLKDRAKNIQTSLRGIWAEGDPDRLGISAAKLNEIAKQAEMILNAMDFD